MARTLRQAGVVAAGLALGAGAIAVFRGHGTPAYHPGTPSVNAFPFATVVPAAGTATPPAPAPTLATEPADAPAAVAAFLQPLAEGHPELAWPLLDRASRTRFASPAAWARGQVDRAQPVSFQVGAALPSPDLAGAFDVDVTATHRSSLDSIRGLVPASSQSVWLVSSENGAWRVSADPVTFRPVLPTEAGITPVVQAWVDRLAACDTAGAAKVQVTPNLYGPASLVQAPCQQKGTWTAGAPVTLDKTSDPKVFLAAYGSEVGTWARLVPVRGPTSSFLVAVAPMGDGWQVMGVAIDGQ